MTETHIIGYFLAIIVGVTLGLIGSGGSILSVPILVYIMGVEPILATAYSLFIVGTTALVGGIQKAKQKLVDFKKVVLFGVPTLITVFMSRKIIVPNIPETIVVNTSISVKKSVAIMIVFALVMIIASVRMIKPLKEKINSSNKINYIGLLFKEAH